MESVNYHPVAFWMQLLPIVIILRLVQDAVFRYHCIVQIETKKVPVGTTTRATFSSTTYICSVVSKFFVRLFSEIGTVLSFEYQKIPEGSDARRCVVVRHASLVSSLIAATTRFFLPWLSSFHHLLTKGILKASQLLASQRAFIKRTSSSSKNDSQK